MARSFSGPVDHQSEIGQLSCRGRHPRIAAVALRETSGTESVYRAGGFFVSDVAWSYSGAGATPLIDMTSRANRACIDWTFEFVIPTCDGEFLARYSDSGLCGLNFPSPTLRIANVSDPQEVPEPIRSWHVLTVEALRAALEGRAPGRFPPLDLSVGSEFQQQVWQRLLQIGPGRTESYGEVAAAIGRPKATRAVGGACGSNPIPVLVPCHRVLAAHQRIGGFSSDPKWKWELLAREGVRPRQR